MEPATHTLTILRPQPERRWDDLRSALERQGAPAIVFDRQDAAVVFTSQTWQPILRARVADALAAVWRHGEEWRVFAEV